MTISRLTSWLVVFGLGTIVPRSAIDAQGSGPWQMFIKADSAESGGQKFADQKREDTAIDLRKNLLAGWTAATETDAQYLLIVVQRDEHAVSGQPSDKAIAVTLSVRDGSAWKPCIKIEKRGQTWSFLARDAMKDAVKWIKEHPATGM